MFAVEVVDCLLCAAEVGDCLLCTPEVVDCLLCAAEVVDCLLCSAEVVDELNFFDSGVCKVKIPLKKTHIIEQSHSYLVFHKYEPKSKTTY